MENELDKAEYFWTELTGADRFDERLGQNTYKDTYQDTFEMPAEGWLQACREALQISQADLAARLGISQQALAKLEKNEVTGGISLERLKSVAAKMDCEVVYYVRHKQKKKFSKLLWQKLLPTALKEYKARMRSTEIKKPMVLAKIAKDLFHHPQFRQKMNWCRNLTHP